MNAQLIDVETGGHLRAERFETADLKEAKNLVDEFAWLLGQRGRGAAVKIPANLGEAYFTCRNNRTGCPSRCRSPSLRRPGGPRNRGRYSRRKLPSLITQ